MGCKLVITLLRCCRDCRGFRRSAKDELARAEAGLELYRQVEAKNKRPSLYPVQFSHIGWWISFCDPTVSRYAGMMFFLLNLGTFTITKTITKLSKRCHQEKSQEAKAYFGMPRRKADETLPPEESLKSIENGRNDTGEFGLSHPSQDLYHPSFCMTFFRVPGSPLGPHCPCVEIYSCRHWCQTPKVGPAGAAAGPHKRIPSRKRKMRKTLRSAWG